MRIGMLADLYKPHISGVTNYIELNKRQLEQLGHEVYVFTFGGEGIDDEPNVIRSPGVPITKGFYFSLRYNARARQLVRSMDVVHVHHPFISGSLALRYCRSRNIPIVFTSHTRYDLYLQAYVPVFSGLIGAAAMQAFLPAFCRMCDLVVSPSPGMREVLHGFGVEVPIEVVPNGVDIKPFQVDIEPKNVNRLGFKPDDVVFVYTGRLGPEKNLSFLLRSFAGATQACDHACLLLVGDGPERDNLQSLAKLMRLQERVHFTGLVPYSEMPRYLNLADVFVTSSITEVHPLSIIEGMAAGLPVLGINSPGVGDTIRDCETGFLIPREDMAAFTANMVRLAVDRELRLKMGEKARQESQYYAIEHTAQIMLDHYQRLVTLATGRERGLRSHFRRIVGKKK